MTGLPKPALASPLEVPPEQPDSVPLIDAQQAASMLGVSQSLRLDNPVVSMPVKSHEAGGRNVTRPTQERFTVAEFADMLGFPVAALNAIIAKNRTAIKKPFYNISELAERWNVSRAQVYNILREAEFKVLNTASKSSEERQSWRIPASVVEKIEQSRMERLPEVAA